MNAQRNLALGLLPAIRVLAVASLLILSSCASPPASSCGDVAMTYKYPGEGSIGERFRKDRWWRINSQNAPEAASEEAKPLAADLGEQTYPMADCSNAQLACVRTYQRVFAVPRGEFKVGARFIAEGASLSLEGCLRRVGGDCQTALFISDCRSADDGTRNRSKAGEIVGMNCRATGWGQQIMFIADRQRGVIAYEQADWWKPGTDLSRWDLSTLGVSAGLMALVETNGLLFCEMSSVGR